MIPIMELWVWWMIAWRSIEVEAAWNEQLMKNVNLYERGQDFDLMDCRDRMDVRRHLLSPKPTCSLIQEKEKITPLAITFYGSKSTYVEVTVESCRKLEVTRTFHSNFLGVEKLTRDDRRWVKADEKMCKHLLERVVPESRSIVTGTNQYGVLKDHFKWFSKNTVTTELYFITPVNVLVDEYLGRVLTVDKQDLNCLYEKEECHHGNGGYFWWTKDESLSKDMECMYQQSHQEVCIGRKAISSTSDTLIAINCEESKTRLYIKDSETIHMELGKRCGVRLYSTISGNIVSMNVTQSDVAELLERDNETETMDLYSLKRLKCSHEQGKEVCSVNSHSQKCSDKCDALSTMTSSFCRKGVCMVPENMKCSINDKKKPALIAMPFVDSVSAYLDKVKSKGPVCIEIRRDGLTVHSNGLLTKRRVENDDKRPFYTLVTEREQILEGHSVLGFTMERGKSCVRRGSEIVSIADSGSYGEAITELRAKYPEKLSSFMGCMAEKGVVDFVTEEEDGTERDFVFKFTGRTSTKSIEGSFIEAQLNYVGALLDQEKRDTLGKRFMANCREHVQLWSTGKALLDVNPDLYVQAYIDTESTGEMQGDNLLVWRCRKTKDWKVTEKMSSGNCTENTHVQFTHGDGKIQEGYIQRYSGRISKQKGRAIPCEQKTFVVSVGNDLMIRYSENETYLLSHDIELHREGVFTENKPTFAIFEDVPSHRLADRVYDLEDHQIQKDKQGLIATGYEKVVNTTNGLATVFKFRGFSLRGILDAEEMLGIVIIVVIIILASGPVCMIVIELIKFWNARTRVTDQTGNDHVMTPRPVPRPVFEHRHVPQPRVQVHFTNVPDTDIHSD